jgi:hypothetical protein
LLDLRFEKKRQVIKVWISKQVSIRTEDFFVAKFNLTFIFQKLKNIYNCDFSTIFQKEIIKLATSKLGIS